jgi:hypothetical protein
MESEAGDAGESIATATSTARWQTQMRGSERPAMSVPIAQRAQFSWQAEHSSLS